MKIYRVIATATNAAETVYRYSSSWHRTIEEAYAVMAKLHAEGFTIVKLVIPKERA